MNPLLVKQATDLLKKIPWKKIMIALAIIIAISYLYRYLNKKKEEKDAQEDIESRKRAYEEYLEEKDLSHEADWYDNAAEMLYGHLGASLWTGGGGWYGCNQDGVYKIFKQIRTLDDFRQLEKSYGTREIRGSYWSSFKNLDLVASISECMQDDEIDELRKIMTENYVKCPF